MSNRTSFKEAFQFFGLTLGLSFFVFWGPLAIFQITAISFIGKSMGPIWAILLFIAGGFVPSGTALFLTWQKEGKSGLRRIGQRLLQYKIGWQWHLAALMVVAAGTCGQIGMMHLLGQSFDIGLFLTQLGSALPLIILGPLSEEIGWRGYALDRLQTRWNALVSSLVLGLVWGLWHLPLFFMPGTSQNELAIPFLGFLISVMSTSVIYTWLHNQTGGSIWIAVFFHWIYTYAAQVVASGVQRSPLYNWLEGVPYILIALIVIFIWKPKTWIRKDDNLIKVV